MLLKDNELRLRRVYILDEIQSANLIPHDPSHPAVIVQKYVFPSSPYAHAATSSSSGYPNAAQVVGLTSAYFVLRGMIGMPPVVEKNKT